LELLVGDAADVAIATRVVVLAGRAVVAVTGVVLTVTDGAGVVSGNSGTLIGNVAVVEPVPGGWIVTFAVLACSVVGRLVLNSNGDNTEAKRFWRCSVTVFAGAATFTNATGGAVDVLAGARGGRLRAEGLIIGPLALAVEPEWPGRTNATSDTTAKATPATNMVASIRSSVVRARSDFKVGPHP
jgi:hypothetical protein